MGALGSLIGKVNEQIAALNVRLSQTEGVLACFPWEPRLADIEARVSEVGDGVSTKLEDRLMALEVRTDTLEASTVSAPKRAKVQKRCRFHPGCTRGENCLFIHAGGEAVGGLPEPADVSDNDGASIERIEKKRCEGCGYFPWQGCATSCLVGPKPFDLGDSEVDQFEDRENEFNWEGSPSFCEIGPLGALSASKSDEELSEASMKRLRS
jgi:hypothetical protein